jgi:dihydroorotate dehydrogenase (fumarate)
MAADLSTRYLGLELGSPLVASASPLTGKLETLRILERSGAGAVVLPSLFEEQVAPEHPGEPAAYPLTPETYVEHVVAAKAALSIPVIASVNGVTPGGWVKYAELLQQAGADAVELNVYSVETDPYASAAAVEERTIRLVHELRGRITVPLAVKLSPYYTALANFASRLADARIDGLVLFNRFLQPDIDFERMSVEPALSLSHRDELRLPLRWIAILHERLPVSLAATSGVASATDVVKLLLAGADVVMLASELLRAGPEKLAELSNDLGLVGGARAFLGQRHPRQAEPDRLRRPAGIRTGAVRAGARRLPLVDPPRLEPGAIPHPSCNPSSVRQDMRPKAGFAGREARCDRFDAARKGGARGGTMGSPTF